MLFRERERERERERDRPTDRPSDLRIAYKGIPESFFQVLKMTLPTTV